MPSRTVKISLGNGATIRLRQKSRLKVFPKMPFKISIKTILYGCLYFQVIVQKPFSIFLTIALNGKATVCQTKVCSSKRRSKRMQKCSTKRGVGAPLHVELALNERELVKTEVFEKSVRANGPIKMKISFLPTFEGKYEDSEESKEKKKGTQLRRNLFLTTSAVKLGKEAKNGRKVGYGSV